MEIGFINSPENIINEYANIIKLFEERKIPFKYYEELLKVKNYAGSKFYRGEIIQRQGFPILTEQWINKFVSWIGDRKCLEVMSGCGSLSKVLQDRKIDIKATDNFTWDKNSDGEYHKKSWNACNNYWTEIEDIDAVSAIEKYKDVDIVIMSWAPYESDVAYKCLQKMREVNPNMVMIYIGEGYGGCTADDQFHESIKEIKDEDIDSINEVYQRWEGVYDEIYLVK